jgi:hypothetical protein
LFTFDPDYVDALMKERWSQSDFPHEKGERREDVDDETDDLSTYSTNSIYANDEENQTKEA